MKQEGLLYFSEIYLTLIGMFLFVSVFLGVVWWTNMKSKKKHYDYMMNLPLKDSGNE